MKGFSLFELTIAIAIMLFLAAGITGAFSIFRDSRELERTADEVLLTLREARARTLASDSDSQFGVFVDASRAVFFRGAIYTEGAVENEIHPFSARVEAHSITIPSGTVVFDRLTGATSASGTIAFRLKNNPQKTRSIAVTLTGLMYAQ